MDSNNRYADVWYLSATKKDLDDTVAIHPTSAEGEWFPKLHNDFITNEINRACDLALNIPHSTVNVSCITVIRTHGEERTVKLSSQPLE